MRLARTFHADWPEHIPGDEHGDVEYAITREEWEELAWDVPIEGGNVNRSRDRREGQGAPAMGSVAPNVGGDAEVARRPTKGGTEHHHEGCAGARL